MEELEREIAMDNNTITYVVKYDNVNLEFRCSYEKGNSYGAVFSADPEDIFGYNLSIHMYDTKRFNTLGEAKKFCLSLIAKRKKKTLELFKNMIGGVREAKLRDGI